MHHQRSEISHFPLLQQMGSARGTGAHVENLQACCPQESCLSRWKFQSEAICPGLWMNWAQQCGEGMPRAQEHHHHNPTSSHPPLSAASGPCPKNALDKEHKVLVACPALVSPPDISLRTLGRMNAVSPTACLALVLSFAKGLLPSDRGDNKG